MNEKTLTLIITLFVINPSVVSGLEPISGFYAGAAALISLAQSGVNIMKCRLSECCDTPWIINNATGLLLSLNQRVHGQHLVIQAVHSHITAHVTSIHPSKALVLSFHGLAGTGKNMVSTIIAQHLFKLGMKSDYVHLISATREFPHPGIRLEYRTRLQGLIENSVKKCPQSLFIFDEMEKIPAGLIDVIKPYVDYHENVGGTDYRKSIFLFLSNSAGDEISNWAIEHWRQGHAREDVQLKDMEDIIEKSVFNSNVKFGLWNSGLITNQLITAFIPFLPLNRTHVRQCIIDSIMAKTHYSQPSQIPQGLVNDALVQLHFLPEGEQVFSTTGCKRVSQKVDFVL